MNETKAKELLRKYSNNEQSYQNVLNHSLKVQKVALLFAQRLDVDLEFIKVACLLHDIGRFSSKSVIQHGIEGAKILRKEGLDEKFALVCERHLGAGISKEEIKEQNLDLPLHDYIPVSKEEKIITMADNLIFGDRIGKIEEVYARFDKELGPEVTKKIKAL